MLAQLLGGKFSPFFPTVPFRQKYQSRLGLSLLFLDSRNHECYIIVSLRDPTAIHLGNPGCFTYLGTGVVKHHIHH